MSRTPPLIGVADETAVATVPPRTPRTGALAVRTWSPPRERSAFGPMLLAPHCNRTTQGTDTSPNSNGSAQAQIAGTGTGTGNAVPAHFHNGRTFGSVVHYGGIGTNGSRNTVNASADRGSTAVTDLTGNGNWGTAAGDRASGALTFIRATAHRHHQRRVLHFYRPR